LSSILYVDFKYECFRYVSLFQTQEREERVRLRVHFGYEFLWKALTVVEGVNLNSAFPLLSCLLTHGPALLV
jgi:hypothetical protein